MSEVEDKQEAVGFLRESLSRTNKQIRTERGEAIYEDLEMAYKREIEDLERDLRREQRKQTNAFDFSPTNSQSLVMGKDFDAQETKDIDLKSALEIHNLGIKLKISKERYNHLFGQIYEL